jgi:hypothetical protein
VPGQGGDDSEGEEEEEQDDLARRARAQADAEAMQRRRVTTPAAAQPAAASDEAAVRPGGGYGRNYRPALRLLADLSEAGATAVVARGGRGGRGNASIDESKLGSQRDASEAGGEGDVVPLLMELKAVADVGLVGAPNVGKSTLLVRHSLELASPIADAHSPGVPDQRAAGGCGLRVHHAATAAGARAGVWGGRRRVARLAGGGGAAGARHAGRHSGPGGGRARQPRAGACRRASRQCCACGGSGQRL